SVTVAVGVQEGGVAGGQFVEYLTKLGDVGAVPGVGVAGDRDGAVAGDDQGEPDQSQVVSFLFGVAAFGDRGSVACGVDERREVRHVQCQPGQVQAELGGHRGGDSGFGGGELGGVQVVHGVPEPAVVGRGDGNLGEPRAGGGGPPLLEGKLAARGDDPVQRDRKSTRLNSSH